MIVTDSTPVDGGRLRVRLAIRMQRPLPFLWLAVRDEMNNETAGGRRPLVYRSIGLPWLRRTQTVEYVIHGLHRGELVFHSVHVAVGDMLGMTARSFVLPCENSVLVRPSMPQSEKARPLPGAFPGGTPNSEGRRIVDGAPVEQASSAGRRPGAGPDLRAYVPGDPLRRVDWRAMARGAGMQTRIGDSEPPGEAFVLLDASAAACQGDLRLFDACAGAAAAAVQEAFGRGDNITLLCGGGERLRLFVRAGDKAACLRAIDVLASLKAEGQRSLHDWICETAAGLARGASFVCVTGVTGAAAQTQAVNGADASLIRAVKIAKRRGVSVDLRIACGNPDTVQSLGRWTEGMKGTGCAVSVLQVPESYRREPVLAEGGDIDGRASASWRSTTEQAG
jgi:uncharacterized protein (DUF58 family)